MSDSLRPSSRAAVFAMLLVLLAGCNRGDTPPAAAAPAPGQTAAAAVLAAPPALKDVIETTPGYIVGISYPSQAAAYPPLAQALHAYALGHAGQPVG